ncbi:MAG: hypothetical protein J2P45_28795 [Candidatus Dormibacteraeota bacterium]|nr:hypothetical protein [Candidatus Dormibacteraeota bacterium]
MHLCGACEAPIHDSPRWLCESCSDSWEAAIEGQTHPRRAADRREERAIAQYKARSAG